MQDSNELIGLGLSASSPQSIRRAEAQAAAESLQFRFAEHIPSSAQEAICLRCKLTTGSQYFHANGIVVCLVCAADIQAREKTAPRSLVKALFVGLGVAIAGSIIYAAFTIATGFRLALISILIGYMVGGAIGHVSGGGRPQQVMAVVLTYLSICSSYVPIAIHQIIQHRPAQTASPNAISSGNTVNSAQQPVHPRRLFTALILLFGLALAAPFLLVQHGNILSILIIFFALLRAWRITDRAPVTITGPYEQTSTA